MHLRRGLFFMLWILLFGSFYTDHSLQKYDWLPAIELYTLLSALICYFGLWTWVAVYRKTEPELARLSVIFLIAFFVMFALDGPITE